MATKRKWIEAKRVVEGMEVWYGGLNEREKKPRRDFRTLQEECFDSGVFVSAEMIRRLTGDEELSMAILECCVWRKREHAETPTPSNTRPQQKASDEL